MLQTGVDGLRIGACQGMVDIGLATQFNGAAAAALG
jgi:hypothetical protein